MNVFERMESEVRSYSRAWPVVFDRAQGSWLHDEDGRRYLDFFAGAGALNYGHNPPVLKRALMDYLDRDGVAHSLDMFTVARRHFLTALQETVLTPRALDYRVVFPGPGGANAVEAALKLARRVTGRTTVIGFTNSFHGMTLGALAVSGNAAKRAAAGVPLGHTVSMPYDGYVDAGNPGGFPELLDRMIGDSGSGLDKPAAVIVETVQGEGGVRAATDEWLRALAAVCRRHSVLLIVDDVQMGCGRTGPFFSFEDAGIVPDMVCLSKSIGGYGLPLALTLIRPDLDVWQPGEHNGTFRGVGPAFVTGAAALHAYWSGNDLEKAVRRAGERLALALGELADSHQDAALTVRGRGLAAGLGFRAAEGATAGDIASRVSAEAFRRGLLVETSGADGSVVKLLPPLTVTDAELDQGVDILDASITAALHT
ncbi:diaminobutyrate--2-oxoglutarate transaminase [Streptomyces kunmingensis]|uniref:Diaminobutyrate--2-oxoglutarate transaminase n=1 Tax=Streptomyces kunmingensis TaxID=68225 RepID=A0ABU6CA17_9ACTN|nr:diaminobutyrate--2-oxoglutarate transaminase [Streptomyces kunmingensis]MEB3960901.1 diaminobutyrate--2-oxoglutarate transaminase [Streptomyces kunmingensis]